jgi:hypothetical protein
VREDVRGDDCDLGLESGLLSAVTAEWILSSPKIIWKYQPKSKDFEKP